jgi:hypothetical protein
MVRSLPSRLGMAKRPKINTQHLSTSDRLIFDPDFYAKVQKTKLVISIVGLTIIAIWNRELLIELFF